MKKLFLVILLSLIPNIVSAQQPIVGIPNNTLTADDDFVEFVLPIGTPSTETITITLTGTFVSTNRVDATALVNGWAADTYVQSIPVIQASDNSSDTTLTVTGTWIIGNVGWQRIRVYATNWTSGTVTVTAVRGFGGVSVGGGAGGGAGTSDTTEATQLLVLAEVDEINTALSSVIGSIGTFTGLSNAVGIIQVNPDTGDPTVGIPGYQPNEAWDPLGTGSLILGRSDDDVCDAVSDDDYWVAPCYSRFGEGWAALSIGGVPLTATAPGRLDINPYVGTLAQGVGALTTTTSTSVIAATALNYIYITNCTISNSSLTVSTNVNLQDGNGGTTLYTLPAPAATVATTGGGGATFTFPSPLKVPTVGNALYAANVTSNSTTVSCSGFKSTVSL